MPNERPLASGHCHANGTPELSPYRDSDIPFETKNVSSGRLASSAKCTPINLGVSVEAGRLQVHHS